MKKFVVVVTVVILALSVTGFASATSYRFDPTDREKADDNNLHDLYDLDHYTGVSWGIDGKAINLSTETITKATLSFDNIRNWKTEKNDLYIRLFDSLASMRSANDLLGVSSRWQHKDNQASGDFFAKYGDRELEHYTNLSATAQDLEYKFDTTELSLLTTYLNDGLFGITFDADCHFYNDGVALTIETEVIPPVSQVPEPGTLLLMGVGLLALLGMSRKK